MTGQEIINKALIELASEGTRPLETGRTLQQELQDALNAVVVDDLPTRWPFSYLVGEPPSTVPTQVGVSVYDLPAGMIEIVDVVLDTGASDSRALVKRSLRRFRQTWAAIDFLPMDKPTTWAQINEAKFQVAPRPNAVYTLRLTGTIRPTPITNFAAEVTAVPARWHQTVVVYGVAAIGASKLRDQEAFRRLGGLYEMGVQRMIAEEKRDLDIMYEAQAYQAAARTFSIEYWKSPFAREVR
jgi:hypothetical protein